jgi:hypothetical protein
MAAPHRYGVGVRDVDAFADQTWWQEIRSTSTAHPGLLLDWGRLVLQEGSASSASDDEAAAPSADMLTAAADGSYSHTIGPHYLVGRPSLWQFDPRRRADGSDVCACASRIMTMWLCCACCLMPGCCVCPIRMVTVLYRGCAVWRKDYERRADGPWWRDNCAV